MFSISHVVRCLQAIVCTSLIACTSTAGPPAAPASGTEPAAQEVGALPPPAPEAPQAPHAPAAAAPQTDAPPERPEAVFRPLDLPTPSLVRTADGRPGPGYWQQRADYVIRATLDAEGHLLTGHETITYTNNSPLDLSYLWLHLEQNLFKNDSLATLSSLPGARFSNRQDFVGGIEIESITSGGVPVSFVVYDTMARLDLASPVKGRDPGAGAAGGGGQVVLEVAWKFRVPDYGVDRLGIEGFEDGEVFEIAQWFPALAVFDDVHGWNTLPYLGQGEFYTDFGDYDVTLTVPRSHLVAATGVLQNEEEVLTAAERERLEAARHSKETVVIRGAGEVGDPSTRPAGEGPLSWRFKASDVRTFAWASSAAFIWDAAAVDGAPGTLVQSVYPKEAKDLWGKSTEMLRFAIEGYNARWFRYPYPVATNVFGIVGGMEYPMIIFCGDNGSERGLYGVTTHEIGHNWFPMIVNTDERRHAWMDEGFNTFINIYSEAERFDDGHVKRSGRAARHLVRAGLPAMDTPPDRLGPGLLGALEYEKTAVALYLLREVVLGPERFDRAFKEYIASWAFKSPRPSDFFRTMENVAGMDLAWFWRGWIVENRTLDQGVEDVVQPSDCQTASIIFTSDGEMVMPLMYRVEFEDGTSEERRLPVEIWSWTRTWTTEIPTGGKRVVGVRVDPSGYYPDVDRKNDRWEAPAAPAAPAVPAADEPEPADGASR